MVLIFSYTIWSPSLKFKLPWFNGLQWICKCFHWISLFSKQTMVSIKISLLTYSFLMASIGFSLPLTIYNDLHWIHIAFLNSKYLMFYVVWIDCFLEFTTLVRVCEQRSCSLRPRALPFDHGRMASVFISESNDQVKHQTFADTATATATATATETAKARSTATATATATTTSNVSARSARPSQMFITVSARSARRSHIITTVSRLASARHP